MGISRHTWTPLVAGVAIAAWPVRPCPAATIDATTTGQVQQDSNLFLAPRELCLAGTLHCSDTLFSVRGSIHAEGGTEGYKLLADAWLSRDRYAHNGMLDNTGYGASIDGRFAEAHGSIVVSGSYDRRLVSFQDTQLKGRAMQRFANVTATATRSLLGDVRWIAIGDFSQSTIDNPLFAFSDYRRYGAGGGLGYYSPTGNVLAIEGHYVRSRGLQDIAGVIGGSPVLYRADFTETSGSVHLLYAYSALLGFDGHIGYARHSDRSGVAGSFSGLIGDASLRWSPRSTIAVTLTGNRSFQSASGILSNGIRVAQLNLTAAGEMTNFLTLSLSGQIDHRDFRFLPGPLFGGAHIENIATTTGKLDWRAADRITVSGEAQLSRRRSNAAGYDYRDQRFTLGVSARFGRKAS